MMKKDGGKMCGPDGCGSCGSCKCPHHMIPSVLVALFGLLFLLKTLGVLGAETVDILWPILVLLLGLMKMGGRKCKCC